MSTCASCAAELQTQWKFCITCGAPVVPAAMRPEPEFDSAATDETGTPRTRLAIVIARYAPLAFSAACFLAAGAVIAWLAINVWS